MFPFPRRLRLVLPLAALLTGSSVSRAAPVSPSVVTADPAMRQAATANTDFGLRLLRRLAAQQPRGNVFFSPFSLSDALAMTRSGAGGAAAASIARTLGLSHLPTAQMNHAYGLLLPSLAHPGKDVQVSIANALWANTGTAFSPRFQQECRNFYAARAATLDFSQPTAADTINHWVSANTRGKIPQLVTPSDLIGASAVLTNAVYFHGIWQTPFARYETTSKPFTTGDGKKKTVPMMERRDEFAYWETPQFQAVSLPYGDGRLSLFVLLPRPGIHMNAFIPTLRAAKWNEWMAQGNSTEVDLQMPRFQANDSTRLKGPLSAMGMAPVFRSGADFQPMGLRGSFIGDVIHKAVLQVNEQGTTASAATGVVAVGAAAPMPAQEMNVNRPFLCAIRDSATGMLLFLGVIRDPQ